MSALDMQISSAQVLRIKVDTAATADLIPAPGAGKSIRILAGSLVAAGSVTATFKNGTGGTAVTGAISLVAAVLLPIPLNPLGHFVEEANKAFNMTLSSGVQVSGWLNYQIIG